MRFSITIGSKYDGHGKHDTYVMESNHTISEMIAAYKQSAELIGIQISGGDDYTKTKNEKNHLCANYQKCTVTKNQYEQCLKHGIDLQNYSGDILCEEDHEQYVWLNEADLFRDLVIDFIKLSLPTLVCEEAYFKNSELKTYDKNGNSIIPNLTDSREIRAQFGYGIYE